jgi:hypothetical protein
MDSLQEDSLESYLLHRIDSEASPLLFSDPFGEKEFKEWEGTTGQLYDVLSECGSRSSQMRFSKTCPSPRVLSAQLKMLEKSNPFRFLYSARSEISPKKINGNHYWRITARGATPEIEEGDCL